MSDPLPQKRTPDDVEATEDTLHHELSMVCDRHNGDLSHAQIVRSLFDFADTYAMVQDVARHVERRESPEGDDVAMVVVPDAEDSLAPINFEKHEVFSSD